MSRRGGLFLSLAVGAASSAAIARGSRRTVEHYFPTADEWSILAHSHPTVADPKSWFTEGFRNYFLPPEGLPASDGWAFTRPLFNATYWAVGRRVAPESGRYLHLSHAGIGACAAITTLAIARSGGSLGRAAASGAVMPLMPAFLPSLALLYYPCMAFDPMTATVSQAAAMAYEEGRFGTAAGLMVGGVLTKETALPTAGALPALFALQHRGALLRSGKARRQFAALAAPAAIWFGARRAAFGSAGVAEPAQHMRSHPAGAIAQVLRPAAKFPFWVDFVSLRGRGTSVEKAIAGASLVANAMVMGGTAVAMGSRLRRSQLSADEMSLASSYAFLLLVGSSPRYGASLDVSLFTSLARWQREAGAPIAARRTVTAGLAVGVIANAVLAAKRYPRLERNFLLYAEMGRKYVAALRQFGTGERVLVLNDPSTMWAQAKYLTRTMGIDAEVIKLADYPFSIDGFEGVAVPSTVSLEPPMQPGGPWRFTQSEGLDILASYARLRTDETVHVDYGDGITIDLEPALGDHPPMHDHQRWAAIRIMPGTKPAHLLYYDPVVGEFKAVPVNQPG